MHSITSIANNFNTLIHLYADNTQLFKAFTLQNLDEVKESIEKCLLEVKAWMSSNIFKLHDLKTAYLAIGSKHNLKVCPDEMNSIKVGDTSVTRVSSACNIGLKMDETLKV